MHKRDFLTAGLGVALTSVAGAGAVQPAPAPRPSVPHRMAKTSLLFKAPPGMPNALATTPEGLWIGEQKMSGFLAAQYKVPEPSDLHEAAWLVDWNGKLLKTVMTECRNTSGMAVGGGYVWMCAEFSAPYDGIYQTDMNGRLVSHRQVPLGPPDDGGGVHGALWREGKLWVLSNRLHAIMRIDPTTWTTEFMIPLSPSFPRYHGIAWDENDGGIWAVTGMESTGFKNARSGLAKFDTVTGRLVETVELVPGSADPHGLAVHEGKLISCDAGIHPNWPAFDSPTSGYIFQIDFI